MQRNSKKAQAIPPQYPLSKYKKQQLFQPQGSSNQLKIIKKFLQDYHNNSNTIKNVKQLNQIFRSVWIYKCASLSNALLYITTAFKKQQIFESWKKVAAKQKRNTPPKSQRFRKQFQLRKALQNTEIDIDNNNPISELKLIIQRLFMQPEAMPQALLNITTQSQSKQLFYNEIINPKLPKNLKYLTINIIQKSGLTKLKQNSQTYIFDNVTRYCHLYIFPSFFDGKVQGIKGCWFVLIQSFNRNKVIDNRRLWTRQRFIQNNFIKQQQQEQQEQLVQLVQLVQKVQKVQKAHPKQIVQDKYFAKRKNTTKQTTQTNSNIFPSKQTSLQQSSQKQKKVDDKNEKQDNNKQPSRIIYKQSIFTKLTQCIPIIITIGIIILLLYNQLTYKQFCRLVRESFSDQ